ncbi:MAG TPA: hypothetical protein HPP87_05550 [Planctomycetes bacterium]|nr:hypothetical protein [Planctomycetota bacterium]
MKKFLIISVLLLTGCNQYVKVDQLEMGMTIDEVTQLELLWSYRGQTDQYIEYSCKLKIPSSYTLDGWAIKPYILTFKDNKLHQIMIDERELDRQIAKNLPY